MKSVDKVINVKKGRPSVDTEQVTLRLSREILQKLDDWRREQPDLPNRPEAIRRILGENLG